jgi:uncharacterized iron-regulated membrane protein
MKQTLTQAMAWLHTWAGLIIGWLLFAVFLTGTLAVFDAEIDHWMQPEIHSTPVSQLDAAQRALSYLADHHADAKSWGISLPTERSPGLTVSTGDRRSGTRVELDPASGAVIQPRETVGGSFFFRFHFTLNLPRTFGVWLVGGLALVMLATLVSGIIIHKKFFKEFFTFRPGKGQRSWLDFHNASAVLMLPFHFMIAYTGLVIFLLMYMPAAVDSLFKGDTQAYAKAAGNARQETPRGDGGRGQPALPANLTALAPVFAEAEQRMGPLAGLTVLNPGTSAMRLQVRPVLGNRIELSKGLNMEFDGVSGKLLKDVTPSRASLLTQKVMAGLHFAQFGGYPLRWLYFVCGLVSCAMIASGLVLFCVKRRRKLADKPVHVQRWQRVAEVLNITSIAGLSIACVGLLWANRLLPAALEQRAGHETTLFFVLWATSLVHASLLPTLQAWRQQLASAAVLCLLLPVLGLFGPGHDLQRLYLELAAVGIGLLLLVAIRRIDRKVAQAGSAAMHAKVLGAKS